MRIAHLNSNRPLAKVCNHEKKRVAPQLRYVGVEALAGRLEWRL